MRRDPSFTRCRAGLLRSLLVAGGLATLAAGAVAQEDPIAKRRAIYKSFGQAAREPGAMLKGDTQFDLPKVQAALRLFREGSRLLPGLFPDTSKTGGDTAASPRIWEDKARFEASFATFGQDAEAGLTAIKDEASFKTEFPKVLRDCGGCHETYRLKR
jgi:cytochrome c556